MAIHNIMSIVEQRRFRSFVCVDPIGFVNNMLPGSIATIFNHIGAHNIVGSKVLEVGCGQGYLVSHLLNAHASNVIGTECDPLILNTIPKNAFNIYTEQGQTVSFIVQSFEETPFDINVNIITMFIGSPRLVYRLLDLFEQNESVRIIAFMRPISGRTQLNDRIAELSLVFPNLVSTQFKIKLSGSLEQRQAMVLKKTEN